MLNRKQKYLQIALNSTLEDARDIIGRIPLDERIIIEAGTPLIKAYGINGIRKIRFWWESRVLGFGSDLLETERSGSLLLDLLAKSLEKRQSGIKRERPTEGRGVTLSPYIVADLKCMDRGAREVEIAKEGGADAVVALGRAPVETLDAFAQKCEELGIDSMIDMMNVEYSLEILRQLKKIPKVVVLHRGVDEEAFNPESEILYHEIARIKNEYDIMVAVAGGDTIGEVQRAIFNDADIVVVWKSFYQSTAETAKLAKEFLKDIR